MLSKIYLFLWAVVRLNYRKLGAIWVAGLASIAASAAAGVGPTVREVIEFQRIIQPIRHDDDSLQHQVSPNGERAFVVTRKPDVGMDTNRFEILLLDVQAQRLSTSTPAPPESVLTVEARRDEDDHNPPLRDVAWVGNRTLVFRARMNDEPFQVYQLDVPTRRLSQMTFTAYGVAAFDVSSDLRWVVVVSPVPNPAKPPGARSVVVGTNSFWSVHHGQNSFRTQQRRYQYLVAEAGSRTPPRPLGESFAESSGGFPSASISPDGRWVVLPRYESGRQLAWAQQYPLIAEATAKYGPSLTQDPLGYFSRPMSYVTRRFIAFRLVDGQEQVVLDAPDDSLQTNQLRTDRLWLDGGRSVIIAGTHIPLREGDKEAAVASYVVEYWPDSGRWQPVAKLNQRLKAMIPSEDQGAGFVAIDGEQRRRFRRGADGAWHELTGPQPEGDSSSKVNADWRIRIRQALNQPPDVVADGPGGATVRLTELNPQFLESRWGTMREYSWKDARGRPWNGGLMVPADFNAKVKHALVIQPYGFSPTRFYRDGSNVYDGFTSGFAGRAFLRENILVLALPWGAASNGPNDERGQIVAFTEGVKGAIDALVAEGWVDRQKIGIMGWSSTGERVLNLVTFTDAPIRAASLLDGDANTLFSLTVTYAVMDGIQARKERANEGGPFGESRERWIRNDPSLHTDCIRAALRMEAYGPEVHNNWDLYALLRRQYRPVEMVVIPEGAHGLSRPSERMISLQGNVDWYRFWLNGERRSELIIPTETTDSLRQQYERWDQMVKLKVEADAKPRCQDTEWTR
ncbi:alpha/beta hydrolase family protein [Roseateles sp. NT4]|uniref:alpha/beta hydrolase family protein n=1 Tax=Roseateles sp. NT4 TaxID=3453715 RepID=UPI003EEFA4A4